MRRAPRWVVILVAALGSVAAAGCGAGGDETANTPPPEAIATEPRKAQTGPIRVGVVPQAGGPTEYNALAMRGLQDAIEKLRVLGRVVEPASEADYLPVMSRLGRERYDLIISIGSGMAAATRQAAQLFPDTMFAIVDYAFPPERTPPNVEGLIFDEGQGGYLAGYLAGMMSRTGTVSTIAGRKTPAVQRLVAGFHAGAKAARRTVTTLTARVGAKAGPAACRRVALAQIARGSDVVFPVAGSCSIGALNAVAEPGVWGVGVDTDQSYLGPHILTSAVKNVDVAVFDAIQGVANGAVEARLGTMSPYGFHGGGVTVYGVPYRGVGLGRVSPQVPPRMLARINVIKRRMTGGAITIPEAPGYHP